MSRFQCVPPYTGGMIALNKQKLTYFSHSQFRMCTFYYNVSLSTSVKNHNGLNVSLTE